eukprot:TRINITY_DN274_c0_g1_i1.p1 TRINITY_DN274_c0_g1~~TRINITY_DN274_c0_g1_i1.p1  ORF type:complete len:385 (-),score=214.92 TRINITY_DN274_c0_g1_i1:1289-2443(-)
MTAYVPTSARELLIAKKGALDVPKMNARVSPFCKLQGLQMPLHIAKHEALMCPEGAPGITKARLTFMTHKAPLSNSSGWKVMRQKLHIAHVKAGVPPARSTTSQAVSYAGSNLETALGEGLLIKRCQKEDCKECAALFGERYACGDVLPPFAEWSHSTFPDAREEYDLSVEGAKRVKETMKTKIADEFFKIINGVLENMRADGLPLRLCDRKAPSAEEVAAYRLGDGADFVVDDADDDDGDDDDDDDDDDENNLVDNVRARKLIDEDDDDEDDDDDDDDDDDVDNDDEEDDDDDDDDDDDGDGDGDVDNDDDDDDDDGDDDDDDDDDADDDDDDGDNDEDDDDGDDAVEDDDDDDGGDDDDGNVGDGNDNDDDDGEDIDDFDDE